MALETGKKYIPNQRDQWVLYGLLAIAVCLPLAMSTSSADSYGIVKILVLRILTLITLSMWALGIFTSKRQELRISYLDYTILAFLALSVLSTLNSIHVPTAIHGAYRHLEGLLTLLNYGIIFFLAVQTFTNSNKLSRLSSIMVISGGIVALYGVLQYLGLQPTSSVFIPFEKNRSSSTFGNPNFFGGFMALLIPVTIAEFNRLKNIKDKLRRSLYDGLVFLCYVLVFAGLLLSFTRGAWIGGLIALLTFAALSAKTLISNRRKTVLLFGFTALILVVVALASINSDQSVVNLAKRFESVTQISEGSVAERIEIWKAGLKVIESNPFLGSGPDTFRLSSVKHQTLKFAQMEKGQAVADDAHNYIIQLAAGVGIPAVLILLFFFITVVMLSIKNSYKLPGDEKLVHAGLIAAVIGYSVHLLFTISVSGSTAVFWIIIGALAATLPATKTVQMKNGDKNSSLLKTAVVALIVFSVITSYFAVSMFVADYNYARAVRFGELALRNGDQQSILAAIEYYDKAISLYGNGKYYDKYGAFVERLGIAQRNRDTMYRALEIYRTASVLEPTMHEHYRYMAAAQLRLMKGPQDPILDEAMRDAGEAIRLSPNSYKARFIAGTIRYLQGRYEDAVEEFEYAAMLNSDDHLAVFRLAASYEAAGKTSEARKYYKKALALKPNNKEIMEALNRLEKK